DCRLHPRRRSRLTASAAVYRHASILAGREICPPFLWWYVPGVAFTIGVDWLFTAAIRRVLDCWHCNDCSHVSVPLAMNRKERRALGKQHGLASPAAPLLAEASAQHQIGKLDQAARLYRRALALEPNNAKALNALACVLLGLGELEQASARFAQSITLV